MASNWQQFVEMEMVFMVVFPELITMYRIYCIRSNFRGSYILWKAGLKDFCGLFFTDHQVETLLATLS